MGYADQQLTRECVGSQRVCSEGLWLLRGVTAEVITLGIKAALGLSPDGRKGAAAGCGDDRGDKSLDQRRAGKGDPFSDIGVHELQRHLGRQDGAAQVE